jgi:preprotein translocase subunit SecF
LSALASIASVLLFLTVGLNYGIDFSGGTLLELVRRTALPICRTR